MKNFFKSLFIGTIICSSLIIILFLWLNKPTGNIPEAGVEFEIKKGDSSASIAERLFKNSFINSKELFIIITKIFGLDKNLKAGWVEIESKSNTIEIVKNIYIGDFVTVAFTIPEGDNIKQIKQILIKENIADEKSIDDFLSKFNYPDLIGLDGLKTAEGFLFPDTYKFYKGVDVQTIFSGMVDLFYKKLEEIYPNYKELSKKELYNKIILASIIEREVKLKEEAPIVAGVFYNRINTGMRLQSCATVQYILNKPKEQLLEKDLELDNPYNTYLYKGLPPGPISNPGYISIKSAFYPKKHNYLFFVIKDPDKGSHYFSSSYSQHLNAQKKYKKMKGFY